MTIPNDDAPYESDIRSNNSSGIGGLFLQLAAIANGLSSLPQLLIEVQAIRTRLDTDLPVLLQRLAWLSGTTAPNTTFGNFGLPGYLGTVLGSRALASSEQFTIWEWLSSIDTSGGIVTQALGGNPAPIGIDANVLVEQLAELRTLNDVNGRPLNEPSGVTNKFLLNAIEVNTRRAADCCEEGSGGEPGPDNPLNDPPVNFGCPNAIRVSSWANRGTQNVSGVESTLWQATFNTLPTGIAQVLSATTPGSSYGIAISPTKYDLCISWNFNQNAIQPNGFGRNRNINPQTAANDNFANGPTASGASFIVGGLVDELSNCVPDDPEHDFCGYIFRVPGTEPPALNAFISAIERSCAV